MTQETPKTPAEKIAELEYELRMFEDGVKSTFWQLLKSQWQPIVESHTNSALSGTVADRGFAAGKANGERHFLRYPEKHIKKLQQDLKTLRGQVSQS